MADLFTPEEFEKIRQLLELFGSNKLSELTVSESSGYTIEIVAEVPTSSATQPYISQPVAPVVQPSLTPSPTKLLSTAPKSGGKTLNSPMVGIFYSAGAPGDPPFVNVGDVVAVGQTIGLIEAMKVFSEIPAESAGRIVEAIAVSGTLVQQSEPLFRIEPA